jgi:hypothetical protein
VAKLTLADIWELATHMASEPVSNLTRLPPAPLSEDLQTFLDSPSSLTLTPVLRDFVEAARVSL